MHIETTAFKSAFDAVRHIAESGTHTVMPILNAVRLFTPEGGRLVLAACDTTMEARCALACEGEALDVCLPVSRIAAVLTTAGEKISIEHTGPKTLVKTGRSRHTIACLPGDGMPAVALDSEPAVKIKVPEIGKTLASVAWAAAKGDLARPYLNGVQITGKDDVLTVAATNGGMLAINRCDVEAVSTTSSEFDVIVGSAAVARIIAFAPEHLEVRAGVLRFLADDRELIVKTFPGAYPDWRRLIPKPTGSLRVNREALVRAVAAAASYDAALKPKDKALRAVMLKSDGHRLVIYSPGKDEGCRSEIDVDGITFEAAYVSGQVLRALAEHDSEEVELHFAKQNESMWLMLREGEWRFMCTPTRV